MLKIKLYSLDIIKIILNKNKKIILINKKDFITFEKELKLLYYKYKVLKE